MEIVVALASSKTHVVSLLFASITGRRGLKSWPEFVKSAENKEIMRSTFATDTQGSGSSELQKSHGHSTLTYKT